MPITKSAKKALKQSRSRRVVNLGRKRALKETIKKTTKASDLAHAQSVIDKIAKTGYIKEKKAARLKSRLAKSLAKAPAPRASKAAKSRVSAKSRQTKAKKK